MDWNVLRSRENLLRTTSSLSEDQLIDLCEALLFAAAQITLPDRVRTLEVFSRAERFGVHFLPVHFYSPLPVTRELSNRSFGTRYDVPGINLERDAQLELLRSLSAFASELSDVTEEPNAGFSWRNAAYPQGDAACYYALIRFLQPSQVIDIGSGLSTFLALRALRANGHGSLVSIDPYPRPELEALHGAGEVRLLTEKVQDVPLATFDILDANDVLFIDSTHVSKIGSDVNHEIFAILPRIRRGVWCHFHDIFYPWEYPVRWIRDLKLFWNEQYLLTAFLAFNREFEVKLANQCVERELSDDIAPMFCIAGRERLGGSSLWIRRTTEPARTEWSDHVQVPTDSDLAADTEAHLRDSIPGKRWSYPNGRTVTLSRNSRLRLTWRAGRSQISETSLRIAVLNSPPYALAGHGDSFC